MSSRHIFLAIAVTAMWGFTFVVIEWGLRDFPPLLMSALRFAAAALPAVFFLKRPPISWRLLTVITFFHVMQFNLLFIGMYAGMAAGLASLVLQLQAFFTIALAVLMLGERPGLRQLAGTVLAFAGIAFIAFSKGGGVTVAGLGLTVLAGLSWAFANIFMKRAGAIDMVALFVWVAALGVLPMLLVSVLVEGAEPVRQALSDMPWRGLAAVLTMAYGATLFGFGAWGHLLRHYPAGSVAVFSLLVPVFGMSFAWLFLGEQLTPLRLLAAAVILAGLYLVIRRPPNAVRAARD